MAPPLWIRLLFFTAALVLLTNLARGVNANYAHTTPRTHIDTTQKDTTTPHSSQPNTPSQIGNLESTQLATPQREANTPQPEGSASTSPFADTAIATPAAAAATEAPPATSTLRPPFAPRAPALCAAGDYENALRSAELYFRPRPLNYVTATGEPWQISACEPAALCALVRRIAPDGRLILVVGSKASASALATFVEGAAAAGVAGRVLVAATDPSTASSAARLGCGGVWRAYLDAALADTTVASTKYRAAALLLRTGATVLYVEASVTLHRDPFAAYYGDSDVEVAAGRGGSGGGSNSLFTLRQRSKPERGMMTVASDPQMGWSQMCESYEIGAVSPHFWFAAPSAEAARTLTRVAARLEAAADDSARAELEPYALTEELIAPAHDGERRAGASVRVIERRCAGVGGGEVATVPESASSASFFSSHNALLASREFRARPQVLSAGCVASELVPPAGASAPGFAPWVSAGEVPTPRPLNWLLPGGPGGSAEWPPPARCAELSLQPLCETLRRIAPRREVIAAVSNKNLVGKGGILEVYMHALEVAGVNNSLVVALDAPTGDWLEAQGANYYLRALTSRTGSTDNHATSGLKFKVLVDFLSLGCSILLSDVDVIWLSDPFAPLYRDSDIEGMSDGWDEATAYGHNSGSGTLRIHARNSGMFFVQATHEALGMFKRLARRMETEGTWDQSAYNQEQFHPAVGAKLSVGVTSRVMNYLCNLNSKNFFRFLRHDAELLHGYKPRSLHINYHPEKLPRMRDVAAYYHHGFEGDSAALTGIWKWNGGEGSALSSECAKVNLRRPPDGSRPEVAALLGAVADWGTCSKCMTFLESGVLKTPWGEGRWVDASTEHFTSAVAAQFFNVVHMLVRKEGSGVYDSTRCSDGERLEVRVKSGSPK